MVYNKIKGIISKFKPHQNITYGRGGSKIDPYTNREIDNKAKSTTDSAPVAKQSPISNNIQEGAKERRYNSYIAKNQQNPRLLNYNELGVAIHNHIVVANSEIGDILICYIISHNVKEPLTVTEKIDDGRRQYISRTPAIISNRYNDQFTDFAKRFNNDPKVDLVILINNYDIILKAGIKIFNDIPIENRPRFEQFLGHTEKILDFFAENSETRLYTLAIKTNNLPLPVQQMPDISSANMLDIGKRVRIYGIFSDRYQKTYPEITKKLTNQLSKNNIDGNEIMETFKSLLRNPEIISSSRVTNVSNELDETKSENKKANLLITRKQARYAINKDSIKLRSINISKDTPPDIKQD